VTALRKWLSRPLARPQGPQRARAQVDAAPHAAVVEQAADFARAGRFERALAVLDERLHEDPHSAELHYARGLALCDWGRLREALDELLVADSAGFSGFALHLNLAQVAHRLGMAEFAESHLRRALALNAECVPAHLGLAAVLQGQKKYDEALGSFERARALSPGQAQIVAYMATCRLAAGDANGAEKIARDAVALDADSVRAWAALGSVLSKQDRHDEAVRAFERAEALETSHGLSPETFVAHGFNLIGFGRPDAAIALYRRYLPEHPHANAQTHCGFAQLTLGIWRQGWANYEFRWCSDPLVGVRVAHRKPRWKGQDLRGKSLLLWTEQGIGDFIQFARFVRSLKGLGARVIVQVSPAQLDFAKASLNADWVVGSLDEVGDGFDLQIPMMSVPGVLGLDEASIPADVPYLGVDPQRAATWRERCAAIEGLRVGIVWAGNPKHERDRYRSIALALLDPVLRVAGASFVSLQKERRDGESPPVGVKWMDAAPMLQDFRDTSAAIQALDLVITVDTAVAHLAGALGKPVWLLLPAAGDFRWLTDREDSPWYPTMRLFRQAQLGDWSDAVARIADALARACAARPDARPAALLPRVTGPFATHGATAASQLTLDEAAMTRVTETRHGIVQYRPKNDPAGRALECYGEWLQQQVDWLLRALPAHARVVEVAAGFGAHTLALAHHLAAGGHLFAYESEPQRKRLLGENLGANRVAGRVTLMLRQLAGPVAAAARDAAWAAAGETQRPNGAAHVETLDELQLERLDLVKLNSSVDAVEILRGAAASLWRCRPLLMIAVDDAAAIPALADAIKSFGYRCWRLETPLFHAHNHDGRSDDVFGGAKATALLGIAEEQSRVEPPAGASEI